MSHANAAMIDPFPIYAALWRRAQDEGAIVRYEGTSDNGEAGWFHPTRFPRPTIVVVRPYYMEPDDEPHRSSNAPSHLPQPCIDDELITLAHEYVHFRSHAGKTERVEYERYDSAVKQRDAILEKADAAVPSGFTAQQRWDRLRAAIGEELDERDRQRIVDEEQRAWDIGREALVELGHSDFTRYDERVRQGIGRAHV